MILNSRWRILSNTICNINFKNEEFKNYYLKLLEEEIDLFDINKINEYEKNNKLINKIKIKLLIYCIKKSFNKIKEDIIDKYQYINTKYPDQYIFFFYIKYSI
jgi:hypothetical protein